MDTKDTRSLGQLFQDLVKDIAVMIQQEVRLTRAEMGTKVSRVARPVGFVVAGGLIAYAGFLTFVAAAVILLHALVPLWVSALFVGLVVVGAGWFLIQTGLQQVKHQDLLPRQAIASLATIRNARRS
ncbi:MAG: phage holin family protein [Candidatus Dormibacteraeota bacterium]|nr:phage holin family protein [Candidatus Dormibacteraeota bacterium]